VAEVADGITQDSEICFIKAWTSGQPVQVSEVWRKIFVVEVDDVITQGSGICFIKAWTSGQPVQVSEVWRKLFWLRLITSSCQYTKLAGVEILSMCPRLDKSF
jgi:hypothetical protein